MCRKGRLVILWLSIRHRFAYMSAKVGSPIAFSKIRPIRVLRKVMDSISIDTIWVARRSN